MCQKGKGMWKKMVKDNAKSSDYFCTVQVIGNFWYVCMHIFYHLNLLDHNFVYDKTLKVIFDWALFCLCFVYMMPFNLSYSLFFIFILYSLWRWFHSVWWLSKSCICWCLSSLISSSDLSLELHTWTSSYIFSIFYWMSNKHLDSSMS